nr:DUF2851 family protein [Flavihumibacter profundi]
MQERLLQFIWQEKYFNTSSLFTETGEEIVIQDAGLFNTRQGPDFLDARILLNGTKWAGHVEIHIKSSQWYQHKHHSDKNYNNVILHVVWENDDKMLSDSIPTLVLQNRVPSIMLSRYQTLMQQNSGIACKELLHKVPETVWKGWKKELLTRRLTRKSEMVLDRYTEARNNWEECSWWWIARQFGGPVNAVFFEQVARSLPINTLMRHRSQVIQMEALLLGQANFLKESNCDPYVQLLQREHRFLSSKYQLSEVHGQAQLLRMRPAGFPAVRLAQLAMLLHRWKEIQTHIFESNDWKGLETMLNITANDFWHYHYTLEEATPFQPKHLGKETIHHLIINAIVPLVYAIGYRHQQPHFRQRAISWLEELPAEKNSIISNWNREGIISKNAAGSQALCELKNYYCNYKKCLDCQLCHHLLNR